MRSSADSGFDAMIRAMDEHGREGGSVFSGVLARAVPVVSRPRWFESIVRLMVDGPGREDQVLGVIRAHVDDDGGTTFLYQVARRGRLVRCTSLDGGVHMIAGHDTVWRRREDASGRIVERPRVGPAYPPDDYEFGTTRDTDERWEGDDFTIPTSPAQETTFLGRPAWEIELAPPPHKPEPMQIIVDRHTGLLLREANLAFGTFHEWIELDTDPDLSDDLFVWRPSDTAGMRYG